MIRSTIFWIHLVCGVATGLVVLMMSVTGVLLTYERQILAWAERATFAAPAPGAERLALEELVAAAKLRRPELTPTTITVRNEPDAPVVLGAGRNNQLLVDPYSGEVSDPGGQGLRSFFSAVTGWHRWFNATGESRATYWTSVLFPYVPFYAYEEILATFGDQQADATSLIALSNS